VAGLKDSFQFCETASAQIQDARLAEHGILRGPQSHSRDRRADHGRRLGGSLQPDGDLPAVEWTIAAHSEKTQRVVE
jgi:hypothetical protein